MPEFTKPKHRKFVEDMEAAGLDLYDHDGRRLRSMAGHLYDLDSCTPNERIEVYSRRLDSRPFVELVAHNRCCHVLPDAIALMFGAPTLYRDARSSANAPSSIKRRISRISPSSSLAFTAVSPSLRVPCLSIPSQLDLNVSPRRFSGSCRPGGEHPIYRTYPAAPYSQEV
jgi:hypothetical protein